MNANSTCVYYRLSVICQTDSIIISILNAINATPNLKVIKLKNRFAKPCITGYRDILVHVKYYLPSNLPSEDVSERLYHICEIQLHLNSIYMKSLELRTYSVYEYFRNFLRVPGKVAFDVSRKSLLNGHEVTTAQRSELLIHFINLVLEAEEIGNLNEVNSFIENCIQECNVECVLDPLQQLLFRIGDYKAAERVILAALNIISSDKNTTVINNILDVPISCKSSTNSTGCDSEEMLTMLFNLMQIYIHQGNYSDAETICNRIRCGREFLFGTDDIRTVKISHYLGTILLKHGKVKEAETAYKTSFVGKEEALGLYHISTLASLDKLSAILKSQKKYDQLLIICRKICDIREKLYSHNDPNTISSMNNLSIVLIKLGRFQEAEKLLKRIIEVKVAEYGEEHSSTIASYDNLAIVYLNQEKFSDAERTYENLLEINTKKFGRFDDSLVDVLCNLGSICQSIKLFDKAIQYYYRAFEILTRTISSESEILSISDVNSSFSDSPRLRFNSVANVRNLSILQSRGSPEVGSPMSSPSLSPVAYFGVKHLRERSYSRSTVNIPTSPKSNDVLSPRSDKLKKLIQENIYSTLNSQDFDIVSLENARSFLKLHLFHPLKLRNFETLTSCEVCHEEYSVVNREHHCRICVRSCCNACSPHWDVILFIHPTNKLRVCAHCHNAVKILALDKADI